MSSPQHAFEVDEAVEINDLDDPSSPSDLGVLASLGESATVVYVSSSQTLQEAQAVLSQAQQPTIYLPSQPSYPRARGIGVGLGLAVNTNVVAVEIGPLEPALSGVRIFPNCAMIITTCLLYTSPSPRDRG